MIFTRFVHYASVVALFGGNAFSIYALPSGRATVQGAVAAFDNWLGGITRLSAILAFFSAVALLCTTAGSMAGSATAAFDLATVKMVLLDTSFGQVWRWRLLLAALLAGACCWSAMRARRGIITIAAGLLLASLALVGHAAMDDGIKKVGHELNDGCHLLAAGLWLGGLLPLLWLLAHLRDTAETGWRTLLREALPPFSQMGYLAVMVLALTGMINFLLLVDDLGGLFDTAYGRLLGMKSALFLTMVAAALINRYCLSPRLAAERGAPYALLWGSVLVEQALGLIIIGVVSLLGTWQPAIHGGIP